MKRFHVHVHVDDLAKNIAFYSAMFNQQPTRTQGDYAKWMLEDPRINFAISSRGRSTGVGHLGFQVDSEEELTQLKADAKRADMTLQAEGETTCCYARSDKYWLTDPQGVAWEQFHTLSDIPVFNEKEKPAATAGSCCATAKAEPAQPAPACCA